MKVLTVVDGKGQDRRLVQMRNPWGAEYEQFSGKWSDSSSVWTDDFRGQADHVEENDGKFFMEFSDYLEQLEYTETNFSMDGWHHRGFLFENDDKPLNR